MTSENSLHDMEMRARLSLEEAVFSHTKLTNAVNSMERLRFRSVYIREGRNMTPRGLLLLGKSGAGKTTAINKIVDRNPPFSENGRRSIPVLTVEVPSSPTKRALVDAILNAMGFTSRKQSSSFDISADIAHKAEALKTDLIVLDEAHHILNTTGESEISEFLKSLLNRTGPSFVYAGLPELSVLHSAPQFGRRLEPDVFMAPFDWTSKNERTEFLKVLFQFSEKLSFPEPLDISDQALARRLYVATEGRIGLMAKCLIEANFIGLKRAEKRLTLRLLGEVHDSWRASMIFSGEIPFDADLSADDLRAGADRSKVFRPSATTNPFLCSEERLEQLANDLLNSSIGTGKWAGRRTSGKGRPTPKAFS